jgi:hypothetical protein
MLMGISPDCVPVKRTHPDQFLDALFLEIKSGYMGIKAAIARDSPEIMRNQAKNGKVQILLSP